MGFENLATRKSKEKDRIQKPLIPIFQVHFPEIPVFLFLLPFHKTLSISAKTIFLSDKELFNLLLSCSLVCFFLQKQFQLRIFFVYPLLNRLDFKHSNIVSEDKHNREKQCNNLYFRLFFCFPTIYQDSPTFLPSMDQKYGIVFLLNRNAVKKFGQRWKTTPGPT